MGDESRSEVYPGQLLSVCLPIWTGHGTVESTGEELSRSKVDGMFGLQHDECPTNVFRTVDCTATRTARSASLSMTSHTVLTELAQLERKTSVEKPYPSVKQFFLEMKL